MLRLTLITLTCLGSCLLSSAGLTGSKPNVVIVITDDQGYGDLSCTGNPYLATPHIDAFYEKSTRFTDFQVSPTCAPTRAAMFSGRFPFEVGVTHTIRLRERLAPAVVTFPQALQTAGYQTGLFGKWHLGDEKEYLPQNRGFNEVLMHGAGGLTQYQFGDFLPNKEAKYVDNVLLHNDTVVKTKGFCTDLFFDAALAWTKQQVEAETPFLTYISLNAPHGPYYAPEKNMKKFLEQGFDEKGSARYAMIENIDENFGKLMTHLDKWEALDNTLVIFMTDNGMAMPSMVKDGEKIEAYNYGMRGAKNSTYEGGTHVPLFCHWQGKTQEGVDVPALTSHTDFYRTFCDLAGVEIPESSLVPKGRSLVPLLENPAKASAQWEDRHLFFHRGRWGDQWNKKTREEVKDEAYGVRSSQWRLVSGSLYDISSDPGEKKDVATDHPKVVAELKAAFDQWWDATEPLLVNEGLEQPEPEEMYLTVKYNEQLKNGGIPDWAPADYTKD